MRIRLAEERRNDLIHGLQGFCRERFDEEIGELKAGLLLDFFVKALGPQVYNQAIQDALKFLNDKLVDLEGEFYEPEDPEGRR
jgi:uncharacterized protein (DUF2164 family)